MGYHITLSRPGPRPGITAEEWKDFVNSRPELTLTADSGQFVTAILDGDESLALHYSPSSGCVFTKNPEGPRIIAYMASIAPHFDGVVTGDEGESYANDGDWGTRTDWDSPPPQKPWWKNELSRGKRLLLGVAIVITLLIVKELLASGLTK